MIIQHNIMALNSHRQLAGNNSLVSKNLEKLSSGYKINRAGDDAAGLAISEKMRAQITGLTRAQSNAQDGISLVQTAEGALTEVHSMLNRMVDLATQSANGTIKEDDRQKVQDEVDALLAEIDRISDATDFNGIKLLDGSLGGGTKTTTPGKVGPSTITPADAQAAVVGDITARGASGAIQVTVSDVTAKAAAGSKAFDATTFSVTGPSNTALNGKTLTLKRGTSGEVGLTTDDKGNATITIEATDGAATGTIKAALNAALTKLSSAHAWKNLDFSSTTITGTTIVAAEGRGGDAMTLTIDKGAAAGKNVKIADGEGTIGTAFVATADWTDGVSVTAANATSGKSVSMKIKDVSGAESYSTTEVAQAVKSPDVAAVTSFKFDDNLKAGATLTVGSGSSAKVFEIVASGTATKNSGAKAVTLGSSVDATIDALVAAVNAETTTLGVTAAKSADGTTLTLTNSGTDVTKTVDASIGGMGLTMQIGDTAEDYNKVTVSVDNMGVDGLGIAELKAQKQDDAAAAIKTIKDAIGMVSSNRSRLGALQNRLEHTINNLGVTTENMTSAESRIRDVDMAKEMMAFTKNNVLSQAAQAMLAQANQQPQQVLQLLR